MKSSAISPAEEDIQTNILQGLPQRAEISEKFGDFSTDQIICEKNPDFTVSQPANHI